MNCLCIKSYLVPSQSLRGVPTSNPDRIFSLLHQVVFASNHLLRDEVSRSLEGTAENKEQRQKYIIYWVLFVAGPEH